MMIRATLALSLLMLVGCTQKDPATLATGSKAMVLGIPGELVSFARDIGGDDIPPGNTMDAGTMVMVVGEAVEDVVPVKFLDGTHREQTGHVHISHLKPMP